MPPVTFHPSGDTYHSAVNFLVAKPIDVFLCYGLSCLVNFEMFLVRSVLGQSRGDDLRIIFHHASSSRVVAANYRQARDGGNAYIIKGADGAEYRRWATMN